MNDFQPNDETLLGYLLGSLEDDEMERVRFAIEQDPELVLKLESLRSELAIFEETRESIELPSGLVERTLSGIWEEQSSTSPTSASVVKASPIHLELIWLKSSWMDALAATAVGIVCISLLAPGILGSRELARRDMCSNNLSSLGGAIDLFADLSQDHRIPSIDLQGPLAFAGSYAIRLNDNALLERSGVVWCPSLAPAMAYRIVLPSEAEMKVADPSRVQQWRQTVGGTYAYNLGYFEEGAYRAPSLENRTQFAIIADAPMIRDGENVFLVHSGRGMNILYEDGHIAFVRLDESFSLEDHPYFNRVGLREAGIDAKDSSLGPSYLRPVRIDSLEKKTSNAAVAR